VKFNAIDDEATSYAQMYIGICGGNEFSFHAADQRHITHARTLVDTSSYELIR